MFLAGMEQCAHTHPPTHPPTHLLRTVIANSVVECIVHAKHSIYIWQDWVGDETREKGGSNHRRICMTEGSAQNKLLTNIRSLITGDNDSINQQR